jgi:polyphosphate kinase 2 (PPK2 family)
MWRHYIELPPRGRFGIFNRTHYENVLVTRVHPEYIMGENIPGIDDVSKISDEFYHKRMQHINDFESHWAENGMIIFKFFLNLSKEEQKNRLLRRLELEDKNWKFSAGDLKERELWDKYMYCYEDMLSHTSKPHAPWYAIPADDKPSARLLVAKIILEKLKEYTDIEEPELDDDTKANLDNYKKMLESE